MTPFLAFVGAVCDLANLDTGSPWLCRLRQLHTIPVRWYLAYHHIIPQLCGIMRSLALNR
jgi:hypothetical protein